MDPIAARKWDFRQWATWDRVQVVSHHYWYSTSIIAVIIINKWWHKKIFQGKAVFLTIKSMQLITLTIDTTNLLLWMNLAIYFISLPMYPSYLPILSADFHGILSTITLWVKKQSWSLNLFTIVVIQYSTFEKKRKIQILKERTNY